MFSSRTHFRRGHKFARGISCAASQSRSDCDPRGGHCKSFSSTYSNSQSKLDVLGPGVPGYVSQLYGGGWFVHGVDSTHFAVFTAKMQGLTGGAFNKISQIGKSVGLAFVAVREIAC
jgi:hypothetical protein